MHIWLTRLDAAPDRVLAAAALLSSDELARADRFRLEHLHDRFVLARAALRRVLARYRGEDAAALAFAYGSRGKPAVAGGPPFNVSHSGALAAIAVVGAGRVGIDVEAVRTLGDMDAIAAHYFVGSERAHIDACAADQRTAAFFRTWTAKEAYVKGVGDGLALGLDSFAVDAASGGPVRADGETPWWTHPFEPGDGFAGAVAIDTEGARVLVLEDVA